MTTQQRDLVGLKALVTGATSGLGRAIASQLARDGAEVIVHGRDAARGAQTVEEATQALNRIKNLQGTEAGMDIAANGGEAMSKSIREARAKESGQPMSKEAALANEAARKALEELGARRD